MHNDTFIKLVEAVEAQGGELLAETHIPTVHTYEIPGNQGRVKREDLDGTGCHQECLFSVPFETEDRTGEREIAVVDTIKMCALDDRMDLMPRFAKALG